MVIWIAFLVLVFFLLALDLGVFHKNPHSVSTKEAMGWTILWVSLAFSFSIVVYFAYERGWVANPESLDGKEAVLEYITGYLIEQSLSMDNIFVIAVIFAYFQIPKAYQHRVLFWGILGALVFRGIMIGIGVVLIQKFEIIIYFFGVLLLYSAYKMLRHGDTEIEPNKNPVIRLFRRFMPVTGSFKGNRFFVKRGRLIAATPLFIALIVVETTDVMFAIDSIPAIFGVTRDPFIVFTSNIFAIMGLRSLYFVLAAVLDKFQYLKYSLVFILAFVGVKMLISHYVHIPSWVSLSVIVVSLTVGIAASWSSFKENRAIEKEKKSTDDEQQKEKTRQNTSID
ncbi:MAG: TerC family protein [Saprospiraceae bacterium]|nr:TerC family protein [Saprospiraceae bacterium]